MNYILRSSESGGKKQTECTDIYQKVWYNIFRNLLQSYELTLNHWYKLWFQSSVSGRCEPNPCQHGGTCTDGVCTCAEGYSGDFCETGKCYMVYNALWLLCLLCKMCISYWTFSSKALEIFFE